jgi:hypothetical protein
VICVTLVPLPKEAAMTIPVPHPRPRPRSRLLVLAGALVAVLAAALVGLVSPASAAPFCSITWGSQPQDGTSAHPGGTLTGVRAGEQACFDRLVVDIAGTTAFDAWHVRYVDHVYRDPKGDLVPLRGGAFLQITVQSPDHTVGGTPTYRPADRSELVDVAGYRTFRQVAWAGESEGYSSIGLGVRAHLPFRVLALSGIPGSANGTRVVIDVAHSW